MGETVSHSRQCGSTQQSACDRPTHLHGSADEAWPLALNVALSRLLVPLVQHLQRAQGSCSGGAKCVRLTTTLERAPELGSRSRPKPDTRYRPAGPAAQTVGALCEAWCRTFLSSCPWPRALGTPVPLPSSPPDLMKAVQIEKAFSGPSAASASSDMSHGTEVVRLRRRGRDRAGDRQTCTKEKKRTTHCGPAAHTESRPSRSWEGVDQQ